MADRLDVLWEMSSDEDVQKFLIETDVSMLTFAFSETRNERLSVCIKIHFFNLDINL